MTVQNLQLNARLVAVLWDISRVLSLVTITIYNLQFTMASYNPMTKHWDHIRAIPQYPGQLCHEVLIFWQKSLRTIDTYHLVPFNLPKNVQGGPFQGL